MGVTKEALAAISSVAAEVTDQFLHIDEDSIFKVEYTGGNGGSFDSFYDEGGFVFYFDTSDDKIY